MNPLKHISAGFWGTIGVAVGAALLAILGYYTKPVQNTLVSWWTKKIELELGVLTIAVLLLLVIAGALYLFYRGSCRDAWDRAAQSDLPDHEKRRIEITKRMGMDWGGSGRRIEEFKGRTRR